MEVKQEVRLILSDKEKQEFEELDRMLKDLINKCACADCDSLDECNLCPYDEFIKQAYAMRRIIDKWRG